MKSIVAMSENRVIGNGGKLPWHLPEDFRFFKQTTLNHVVLMGRKTYESLGKPLPSRRNIVLTRGAFEAPGTTVIHSMEELAALNIPCEEIFVIGGGEIYRMLLPHCDTLFVTHVHRNIEGDVFFPSFENDFESCALILQTEEFTIREYKRREQRLEAGEK